MSPMTRLLLDRTLGILAGLGLPSSEPFVVMQPQLVGSEVPAWVMLTRQEFVDMFGGGGMRLQ